MRRQLIGQRSVTESDPQLGPLTRLLVRRQEIGSQELTAAGVLKETGYELFRGCLTVPLSDVEGKLIGMYGYRIATYKNGKCLAMPRQKSRWDKGSFRPPPSRATAS